MAVARDTRLVVGLGCCVMRERNWRAMQEFVDRLPCAHRYCSDCSDQLGVYQELMWPPTSEHIVSIGKEETYTDVHDRVAECRLEDIPGQIEAQEQMLLSMLGSSSKSSAHVCMALQQA